MNYLRREAGFYMECAARRQRSPAIHLCETAISLLTVAVSLLRIQLMGLEPDQLLAHRRGRDRRNQTRRVFLRQEIVRLLKLINQVTLTRPKFAAR
jgi:hypothetical protein